MSTTGTSIKNSGNKDNKKIVLILDTNAIFLVGKGYNFFEDFEEQVSVRYDCIIPSFILEEAKRVIDSLPSGFKKRNLMLGLDFCLRRCSIRDFQKHEEESIDEALLDTALYLKKQGFIAIVVTSDRELRRVLRQAGIASLFLKEERGRFVLEWSPVI